MRNDRSEVVVLCEGSADETFVRRFLKLRGYDYRKVRTVQYPEGKGCGFQFVIKRYPEQLKEIRRWQAKALIVLLDGDGHTVEERIAQLTSACREKLVEPRADKAPVVIAVPMRNLESWFVYLEGGPWSEVENYEKRKRDDLARASAEKLHELCYAKQRLPEPAPRSLLAACKEWHRL